MAKGDRVAPSQWGGDLEGIREAARKRHPVLVVPQRKVTILIGHGDNCPCSDDGERGVPSSRVARGRGERKYELEQASAITDRIFERIRNLR